MVNLERERIQWTGFPGAPGITTLYFDDAPAAQDALFTLVGYWLEVLPADVTLTLPTSGDIMDPLDGTISGEWVQASSASRSGAGGTAYPAPAGVQITWNTAGVVDGAHLRGRSYLVPAASAVFSGDGTMDDSLKANLQGHVDTFVAAMAGNMKVWHRPRLATPLWTDVHGRVHPALAARAGGFDSVLSGVVKDRAVVLRSRRG